METSCSDRERMLSQSSTPEDVEILRSPELGYKSPYMSSHDSSDDLETLEMHHLKCQYSDKNRSIFGYHRITVPICCQKSRYLILISSVLLIFVLWTYLSLNKSDFSTRREILGTSRWIKPEGFKIVGMVFYGRPPTVSILDCYLKRNLAINGGFLDEVLWMANTRTDYDLSYLETLANSSKAYKVVSLKETGPDAYGSIWQHATENNTLYIKIDDDMVSHSFKQTTDMANYRSYYRSISMTTRSLD